MISGLSAATSSHALPKAAKRISVQETKDISAQALEVVFRRPERVDGRPRVRAGAFGHVGGVLLLVLRPGLGAGAAEGDLKAGELADAVFVHAVLHEEVLSPRAELPLFDASGRILLPARSGALVSPGQEGVHGLLADYLEVAEKALLHRLAVLEVETI